MVGVNFVGKDDHRTGEGRTEKRTRVALGQSPKISSSPSGCLMIEVTSTETNMLSPPDVSHLWLMDHLTRKGTG